MRGYALKSCHFVQKLTAANGRDRRIITDHQEAPALVFAPSFVLTMNVRKVTADRRLMLTNVPCIRA